MERTETMCSARLILAFLVIGWASAAKRPGLLEADAVGGAGKLGSLDNEIANYAFGERVYNSEYASLGQLPYQALIELYNNDNSFSYCGASVVSNNFLVTAAHCITKYDIKIFTGLIDTTQKNNRPTFVTWANYTWVHPQYYAPTYKNDIAVIRTWQLIPLGGNINSIRLPDRRYSNPALYDRANVVVSGWGRTSNANNGQERWLRYQTITVMPFADCNRQISIGNGQVCTDKRINSGPCQGDSGGPLAFFPTDGSQPFLVGAVSFRWGQKDSTGEVPCVNPNPEVYTNVAYYRDWINQVTGL